MEALRSTIKEDKRSSISEIADMRDLSDGTRQWIVSKGTNMWPISATPVPQMHNKELEQRQRLLAANTVTVVCDPPYSPDMALNDSSCSHDDPEILEQSLTISQAIRNSQFQRCFKQRQKCWTRRINSEWDDDNDNRNNTTTTTTNYKGRRTVRYRLNPETSGNTLASLKIRNTGQPCA